MVGERNGKRLSPQVGSRLNELLHALVVEGIKFELLGAGGKGGDHKVTDKHLD